MAITVEIYEEIRQCREKYGYGQRKTARLLKVSRNTVKKYWDGSTVPWDRKQGSGRKNDVLTDEHLKFINECLEEDKLAPMNCTTSYRMEAALNRQPARRT